MATDKNTLRNWFKTGLKPTQAQFWAWIDAYWHKDEKIPQSSIQDLESTLNAKAERSQLDAHLIDTNAHSDLFLGKEDKSQKGIPGGYTPLDEFAKIAGQYLTIIDDLFTGGSTSILSAQQGVVLQNQIDGIKTLLSSDNVNLDSIQEIVDAIELVQISLNTILVNDLTTGGSTKALTAEMGKTLNQIKLTATLATDAETQIDVAVPEDSKVVSRLKLFNWWENIKIKTQTIKAIWNFPLGIRVNNSTGNYIYTTQVLEDMFFSQLVSVGIGNYKAQYGWGGIKWVFPNNFNTQLVALNPTQNNTINFQNKSGTIAHINDFITTPAGTTATPAIIMPIGVLTTVPQNGAIERDANGVLWETHGNVRTKITPTIQNNLTTTTANDVLDAKQGNVLMGYINVLNSLLEGFRNTTQSRLEYKVLDLTTIISNASEQNSLHPYLLKTTGAINLIKGAYKSYTVGNFVLLNNPINRNIDPGLVTTNDKLMSDMDFIIQTNPFCSSNVLRLKIYLQGWGKVLIFRRSNANTAAYGQPFALTASVDFGNSSSPGSGVLIDQAIKTTFPDGILGFIVVHGTNPYNNNQFTIKYLSFTPDASNPNIIINPIVNSAFEQQINDISTITL